MRPEYTWKCPKCSRIMVTYVKILGAYCTKCKSQGEKITEMKEQT